MCEIEVVDDSYDPDTMPFDEVNIKRNILENTHLNMKNSLNSGCVHAKWNFYSVESIKPDPEKTLGALAIEMWISLIHASIRKIWNMWKFKSCKAITWLLIHFSNIVTFYWTVKRLLLVFFFPFHEQYISHSQMRYSALWSWKWVSFGCVCSNAVLTEIELLRGKPEIAVTVQCLKNGSLYRATTLTESRRFHTGLSPENGTYFYQWNSCEKIM